MISVFYFETTSRGYSNGIGAYLNILLHSLQKRDEIGYSLYLVRLQYTPGKNGVIIDNRIDLTIITIYLESSSIGNIESKLISELDARAIFCILYPYLKESKIIFHLNSSTEFEIAKLVKEYNFNLVYTQHVALWSILFDHSYPEFIKKWTAHTEGIRNCSKIASIQLDMKFCILADTVICLNNENQEFVNKVYNVPAEKIALIKNGTSIEPDISNMFRCSRRSQMGFSEDNFIILFVGRLIEQKGIEELILAFKAFSVKVPSARLIIAGEGEMGRYLPLTVDVCGKVSFTGFVTKQTIKELYRIVDIGVSPSRTEQGSFVLLEMMSNGLPVIVGRIKAYDTPHYKHNKNILVAEVNQDGKVSIDDLIQKMEKLFYDEYLRSSIGKNAKETIKYHLNSDFMIRDTFQVYFTIAS